MFYLFLEHEISHILHGEYRKHNKKSNHLQIIQEIRADIEGCEIFNLSTSEISDAFEICIIEEKNLIK